MHGDEQCRRGRAYAPIMKTWHNDKHLNWIFGYNGKCRPFENTLIEIVNFQLEMNIQFCVKYQH